MSKIHRCEKAFQLTKNRPNFLASTVAKDDDEFGWYLFKDNEKHQVIYCPYCGVLLTDEVATEY